MRESRKRGFSSEYFLKWIWKFWTCFYTALLLLFDYCSYRHSHLNFIENFVCVTPNSMMQAHIRKHFEIVVICQQSRLSFRNKKKIIIKKCSDEFISECLSIFFGLGHTVTFFTHMIDNVRKSTAEHPNLFSVWNFDLSFTLLYITKGTITSRILFHYSSHPLGITLEWLSIYQVWFFTYYKWIHPQTDFFRHIRLFNYCTQKYLLYLDKNVCSSCNLNW